MGRASRRKKARKHGLEAKIFAIRESTLKEVIEAINEVRTEFIAPQESTAQLPDLPENRTDFSPCPTCWSSEAHAALSNTIHWAEWRCVVCDYHGNLQGNHPQSPPR
jgi:hypothetical protein